VTNDLCEFGLELLRKTHSLLFRFQRNGGSSPTLSQFVFEFVRAASCFRYPFLPTFKASVPPLSAFEESVSHPLCSSRRFAFIGVPFFGVHGVGLLLIGSPPSGFPGVVPILLFPLFFRYFLRSRFLLSSLHSTSPRLASLARRSWPSSHVVYVGRAHMSTFRFVMPQWPGIQHQVSYIRYLWIEKNHVDIIFYLMQIQWKHIHDPFCLLRCFFFFFFWLA
jgi:hypothetical protein